MGSSAFASPDIKMNIFACQRSSSYVSPIFCILSKRDSDAASGSNQQGNDLTILFSSAASAHSLDEMSALCADRVQIHTEIGLRQSVVERSSKNNVLEQAIRHRSLQSMALHESIFLSPDAYSLDKTSALCADRVQIIVKIGLRLLVIEGSSEANVLEQAARHRCIQSMALPESMQLVSQNRIHVLGSDSTFAEVHLGGHSYLGIRMKISGGMRCLDCLRPKANAQQDLNTMVLRPPLPPNQTLWDTRERVLEAEYLNASGPVVNATRGVVIDGSLGPTLSESGARPLGTLKRPKEGTSTDPGLALKEIPGSSVSGVGISWIGLQAFCMKHKDLVQGKTTLQVRDEVIKSLTAARKASYADLHSEPGNFGPANVFVSHAWSYRFLEDLVEAVGFWIMLQKEIPDGGWFLWIDIFVVNQHIEMPKDIDTLASEKNFRTFSEGFREKLKKIGRAFFVLSPWDKPAWIFRVWCLFEFYIVYSFQLHYEFVMPPTQRKHFVESLTENENYSDFLDVVSTLDMEKATAFNQYDERQIKNLVMKDLGGFTKLNEIVIGAIREFCVSVSEDALSKMDEKQEIYTELLENTAKILLEIDKVNTAEEYLLKSIKIKELVLGSGHVSIANAYATLGLVKERKGEHAKALELYEMSRVIIVRCVGDENEFLAKIYGNIGNVYTRQGNFKMALEMHAKDLEIKLKTVDPDDEGVAKTLHNMAVVHGELGNLDESLELYQRALVIKIQRLGTGHVSCAETQLAIGIVYCKKCNYDQALFHINAALPVLISQLGADHLSVAAAYDCLGNVESDIGNFEGSLECFEKALNVKINCLGHENVSLADTYNSIGSTHFSLGNYEKSLSYHTKAIKMLEKAHGPSHLNIGTINMSIGNVLCAQGDFKNALAHYQKALQISLSVLGPSHANVAEIFSNMAVAKEKQGNLDESLDLNRKALDIRIKCFGSDHILVAKTYGNIANVLNIQGKLKDSSELFRLALVIFEKSFGSWNVEVAATYKNMGTIEGKLGNHRMALDLFEKALEIELKCLGPLHDRVARTKKNIGIVYYQQDDEENAMTYLREAYQIFLKTLGPDHPETKCLIVPGEYACAKLDVEPSFCRTRAASGLLRQ